MQREGSPWQGLGVVTLKELSDHLTSWRMLVLEWLVAITAVVSVYVTIQQVGEVTAEDPYLLLRFFTRGTPLPFVALLSFPCLSSEQSYHHSPNLRFLAPCLPSLAPCPFPLVTHCLFTQDGTARAKVPPGNGGNRAV